MQGISNGFLPLDPIKSSSARLTPHALLLSRLDPAPIRLDLGVLVTWNTFVLTGQSSLFGLDNDCPWFSAPINLF